MTKEADTAETTEPVGKIDAMSDADKTDTTMIILEEVIAPSTDSIPITENKIMSVADKAITVADIRCMPFILSELNVVALLISDKLLMSASFTSVIHSTITTEEMMPGSGVRGPEMTINATADVGPSLLASEGWHPKVEIMHKWWREFSK